jgi:hypothetical protein
VDDNALQMERCNDESSICLCYRKYSICSSVSAVPNGLKELSACEFLSGGTCCESSLQMAMLTSLYGAFQSLGMS